MGDASGITGYAEEHQSELSNAPLHMNQDTNRTV